MKSALRDFILSHPDSWEQELAAAPYSLKMARDNGLIIFKYNQIASDFSLPIVREARGIIFEEATWRCVCRAFDKFGNYGEDYVPDIDWSTAFVSEKIDGSLIKLYCVNDEWMIATNGTIDAFKAPIGDVMKNTYGKLFLKAIGDVDFAVFEPTRCYMFELVSPYTTVVVPHAETDIYFLGSRDLETGQEYTFAEESKIAELFKTPRVFSLGSLHETVEAAAALSWDDEGYVVCDANKNRCKIKSPAYVRAHYIRNNSVVTLKRLVSIILENEQEEFLIYAPEWQDALYSVVSTMWALERLVSATKANLKNIEFANRKEYYEYVSGSVANREIVAYLMKVYENPVLEWQEYVSNWDVNRWTRFLEEEVEL